MASTEVNVGRVQGAGFFYSTYADNNIATTIDKGTVLSELTIFEKDMIVDAKGRLYEVISILGDTINVEYKSTMQGEKGDTGEQGEVGSITLNGEVTQNAVLFAPTDGGSADDILISTGGVPSWRSDIKGFKFSRVNQETSYDVTAAAASISYSVNASTVTSGGYSVTPTLSVTINLSTPATEDMYVVITFLNIQTSGSIFDCYFTSNMATPTGTHTLTIPTIGSDTTTPTTKTINKTITVLISTGESTVTTSFSLTSLTATYDRSEAGTSMGLSVYYHYFKLEILNSATLTYTIDSQYIENGRSEFYCDNLTIDSNGKIECTELWVGGKQIT